LLRQAQTGDAESVERLWTMARPCLIDLCRRHQRAGLDGDSDLVQAVVVRAWQSLDQFHGARDDEQTWWMFRAWLATIVQRVIANTTRDRQRQRRYPAHGIVPLEPAADDQSDVHGMDAVASDPTPGTLAQSHEEALLVREAIDRIADDTDRQIVQLRFFEELSLHQIAQRLGLSYDKTRERYHYCMTRLTRELAHLL
jgi:RNA polymerase sigma factor (sigma-70 family)